VNGDEYFKHNRFGKRLKRSCESLNKPRTCFAVRKSKSPDPIIAIERCPLALQDYQGYLQSLPTISKGLSHEDKAKIIEKLVHKIELKPDRVLVHFYVGVSLLQGESFLKGDGLLLIFCVQISGASKREIAKSVAGVIWWL
jgi:hypothetical protein